MYLLDSGYDWDYPVEPQEKGNSFLRHARAKVLGGCSSHNSCIAFWTPKEDLDEWAAMGCEGWSAADCWPLIKRLETNDGPGDHHGRDGPVNIRTVPPDDPCGVAMLEAAAQAGLPTSRYNEGSHGHQRRGLVPDQLGARQHAHVVVARVPAPDPRRPAEPRDPDALLGQAGRDRGRPGDRGRVPDPGPAHAGFGAGAARGDPVSAGAIDTPKLLMLSGVGPAEHLQEFGIQTLVDSPGVGANLDDHVEGIVQWDAKQADGAPLDAVVGDRPVRDLRGGPGPARPDDALRLGAVRHEHGALGLPDDRERVLPDAERVPRPFARNRAPAFARLPRPRARRSALLHRSRRARRARDGVRHAARAQDRLAAARWPSGPEPSSRRGPTRRPTTS